MHSTCLCYFFFVFIILWCVYRVFCQILLFLFLYSNSTISVLFSPHFGINKHILFCSEQSASSASLSINSGCHGSSVTVGKSKKKTFSGMFSGGYCSHAVLALIPAHSYYRPDQGCVIISLSSESKLQRSGQWVFLLGGSKEHFKSNTPDLGSSEYQF